MCACNQEVCPLVPPSQTMTFSFNSPYALHFGDLHKHSNIVLISLDSLLIVSSIKVGYFLFALGIIHS